MEEKFNRLGLTREECPGYQTEYFEMKDFIFQVVIPAVREEIVKKIIVRIDNMIENPLMNQQGEKTGTEEELDSLKRYCLSFNKENR